MSKYVSFFVFVDGSKKVVTVWAKKLIAPEYFTEFFWKMVWLISFGVTVREILR